MKKQIIQGKEVSLKIKEGIDKLADIVKVTLGPAGLPVILERKGQALDGSPLAPRITKDGVSVASECFDPDPTVNAVMQAAKEICKKTNRDAGDGTTTAITLAQALYNEQRNYLIKNSDVNPQVLKRQIKDLSEEVIQTLKDVAKPVDMDMVRSVAIISANGDTRVGDVIKQAFGHVGSEGVVTVDEGNTTGITVDLVDGYQFNRGAELRDSFFNADNQTKFEVVGTEEEPVRVIIFDGKITNHTELVNILSKLANVDANGKATKALPSVLLIANEFSIDVLQFLLIQKAEIGLNICPVKGPHVSNVRSAYYDDLAVYTGGKRLGNGNRSLLAAEVEDVGSVERVVVTKYTTTLYDGYATDEELDARVEVLKSAREKAESPYDAQVINDRMAALTNGIAKIGVGGATEIEIKERYDRIEDALNAARAAIAEGVVVGGGLTLARIAESYVKSGDPVKEIFGRAMRIPFRQIVSNAGLNIKELESYFQNAVDSPTAYNCLTQSKVSDAYASGLLDPVKVTCSALRNAVSISGLLVTSGGAVVFVESEEA